MTFIENCWGKAWRLWSVQLAALATITGAFVAGNVANVVAVIQSVPPWLRVTLIVGFGALQIVARLAHQPKVTGNANPPA